MKTFIILLTIYQLIGWFSWPYLKNHLFDLAPIIKSDKFLENTAEIAWLMLWGISVAFLLFIYPIKWIIETIQYYCKPIKKDSDYPEK